MLERNTSTCLVELDFWRVTNKNCMLMSRWSLWHSKYAEFLSGCERRWMQGGCKAWWTFETWREIPYLQAALYYLVYLINTVALSRREKSALLTNENKGIDNPQIKIVKCVGDKAQYGKKSAESLQNNNGRHFQYKNKLSVFDFYMTHTNLSATLIKLARGKSISCRFSLSAARNAITKTTECVTFGFSFRNLVFFTF